MAFSLPNIVIKPYLITLFHKLAPCVLPCPKTQEHQSTCVDSWVHRVTENGHQTLGRGNSLWHSACPILWSNPNLLRRYRRLPPLCSLALRLRNTKVPVWTHESIGYFGVPKMDKAIRTRQFTMAFSLPQYCDQTRTCYAISRRSPPVYSLALRLRNTKVPVWTHESIGYRKLTWAIRARGNSLWAFSLPNSMINPKLCHAIVIKPDFLTEIAPCLLPCPITQEHLSTCVDSWVHRVPENGHQPLGRGNSLWRSACPILWSNPILLRYFTKIAPFVLPCPKTQEHQSTCVDSWVHRVPENGHQPLGRAIHYGVQLAQYCDHDFLTLFHWDRPLCTPLP